MKKKLFLLIHFTMVLFLFSEEDTPSSGLIFAKAAMVH